MRIMCRLVSCLVLLFPIATAPAGPAPPEFALSQQAIGESRIETVNKPKAA
jgi:hypothetical protein